ncbi:O-antigen ligase family protein [Methylicorpusculum sp.]|uniref:O-antigen ligase family protein n=1 Tax=Methylicorpusculum sp. TaxID=2713644 RepID=UPI00273144F8|nr:O-antigen ligase family protein [Methylicorpusculum sp.]MDP2179571.1 O-antigen ligase family protein [Methylicorpusculum sp.]MDP3531631.1 O-antigen ligase family protein [Methylicorpusculum sp.]
MMDQPFQMAAFMFHSNSPTKSELAAVTLIILSFALLPLGRTVEVVTAIMAFCSLALLARGKIKSGVTNSPFLMFTLFFISLWLPILLSNIGAENFKNSSIFTIKYLRFLLAGIYVVYILQNQILRDLVLQALMFVISFWLVDGLLQWLVGFDVFGRNYEGMRLTGPFNNLIMPVYLSVFLPVTLAYASTKWSNYIGWSLLLLSLWILLLAGSRASILVLLVGGVVFLCYIFFTAEKKPIIPLAFLVILSVVIILGGYKYNDNFKSRADQTVMLINGDYDSINAATSQRLPIWEAAYNTGINNPINGVGVRGFREVFHLYAPPNDSFSQEKRKMLHPHLFILELFSETGIIGLVGMFGFIFLFVSTLKDRVKQFSLLESSAAITVIIVFFPLNSHTSLFGSSYSQVAWLMMAICCSLLYGPRVSIDSKTL